MERYFEIGKIVNTQGLKGEVRVLPMTDDISRFELLNDVIVQTKDGQVTFNIEDVWYHKQFVVLKFKEINNKDQGDRLRNCVLKIPENSALPLNEDEYYLRDLYDLKVETVDGEHLGVINDILSTGANDVYVIKQVDKKEELLIPAIKQCIIKVDIANKLMIVNLLEGLR